MASEADHISLANKNHDALVHLLQAGGGIVHAEWICVIAFYKAVHVAEAVFANQLNQHSNCHDDRLDRLKMARFSELFKAFRPLYCASMVARYLVDSGQMKVDPAFKKVQKYSCFTDYMPAADVQEKLLKKRLKVLEDHAVSLLSADAATRLKRIGNELK